MRDPLGCYAAGKTKQIDQSVKHRIELYCGYLISILSLIRAWMEHLRDWVHRGFGLKDATRLSNIFDMDSLLHANALRKAEKNVSILYSSSILVKYSGHGISLSEGNSGT